MSAPDLKAQDLEQVGVRADAATVAAFFDVAARYSLNTDARLKQFLAQCIYESGYFRHTREIWGPSPVQRTYDSRTDLGNRAPGDGFRYRGAGLIQVTGRSPFEAYTRHVRNNLRQYPGLRAAPDFVANPDLLALFPWCVDVSGWWWRVYKNGVRRNGKTLDQAADSWDTRTVSMIVKGSDSDWQRRQAILERILNAVRARQYVDSLRNPQPYTNGPVFGPGLNLNLPTGGQTCDLRDLRDCTMPVVDYNTPREMPGGISMETVALIAGLGLLGYAVWKRAA